MYINMFQENNYEQTLFLLNSCLIVKTEQKHEAFCECFFFRTKMVCVSQTTAVFIDIISYLIFIILILNL